MMNGECMENGGFASPTDKIKKKNERRKKKA